MTPHEKIPLHDILTRLAVKRDDEEAWGQLYEQMWPRVMAIVYRKLRGLNAAAEDVSQEVFYRLVKACPFERLTDPEAFKAYLSTVALNVSRNYLREILSSPIAKSESVQERVSSIIDPRQEEPGIKTEIQALLEQIFGHVDSKDRILVGLLIDGYTLNEIASKADISYQNAAVRIYRLRQRYRNYLAKKYLRKK